MPKKLKGTVETLTAVDAVKKFADSVGVPMETAEEHENNQDFIALTYYLGEQVGNLSRFASWKKKGEKPSLDTIIAVWRADVKKTLTEIKRLKPDAYEALLTTHPNDVSHGQLLRGIMNG